MIHFGPNARICSFLWLKIARLSHVGIISRAKSKNIRYPWFYRQNPFWIPINFLPSFDTILQTSRKLSTNFTFSVKAAFALSLISLSPYQTPKPFFNFTIPLKTIQQSLRTHLSCLAHSPPILLLTNPSILLLGFSRASKKDSTFLKVTKP